MLFGSYSERGNGPDFAPDDSASWLARGIAPAAFKFAEAPTARPSACSHRLRFITTPPDFGKKCKFMTLRPRPVADSPRDALLRSLCDGPACPTNLCWRMQLFQMVRRAKSCAAQAFRRSQKRNPAADSRMHVPSG